MKIIRTNVKRVTETIGREVIVQREGITVTLPDLPVIPDGKRFDGVPNMIGADYTVGTQDAPLIAKGTDNPKLSKSDAADATYRTFGLTLAPADMSGYNVCASASDGCKYACLGQAGQAQVFWTINVSRVAKTVAFMTQRGAFIARMKKELRNIVKRGRKQGWTPAVRLNVLSDVMWEKVCPELFTEFPTVQFYDYTKHAMRMRDFQFEKSWPKNYHLTFSRSEDNDIWCYAILTHGGTVAVVFEDSNLPTTWQGYPVVNGDETDMRFRDQPGTVIGLYAKGKARKDDSGFVVPTRRVSLETLVGI